MNGQRMSSGRVTVIDYGVGNVGSLLNMLEFVGVECDVVDDPARVADAERLILPGVGAFDAAMGELERRRLIEPLREAVLLRKAPILGICLGMQILAMDSEEGVRNGLGFVDASVRKLSPPAESGLKVPHIGWAEINVAAPSPLFGECAQSERFYFVHSYALDCRDKRSVAATFSFGGDICCAVAQDNILGVQFHPEKSHKFGMRLLKDFALHV